MSICDVYCGIYHIYNIIQFQVQHFNIKNYFVLKIPCPKIKYLRILYIYIYIWNFLEKFNILENNRINVEVAKVQWYYNIDISLILVYYVPQ